MNKYLINLFIFTFCSFSASGNAFDDASREADMLDREMDETLSPSTKNPRASYKTSGQDPFASFDSSGASKGSKAGTSGKTRYKISLGSGRVIQLAKQKARKYKTSQEAKADKPPSETASCASFHLIVIYLKAIDENEAFAQKYKHDQVRYNAGISQVKELKAAIKGTEKAVYTFSSNPSGIIEECYNPKRSTYREPQPMPSSRGGSNNNQSNDTTIGPGHPEYCGPGCVY